VTPASAQHGRDPDGGPPVSAGPGDEGPRADARRDALPGQAPPEIVLDISRLLSRIRLGAPTGVDRVEMVYATELLRLVPDRISFAAVHPSGLYGRMPNNLVAQFLETTSRDWRGAGASPGRAGALLGQLGTLVRTLPRPVPNRLDGRHRDRVYLQASPHHLDRPRRVREILSRERARLVCLIFDLIPIEFPEYARPNGRDRHRRRMRTVAELADAVIVTSQSARRSFLDHIGGDGRTARVVVASLGADDGQAQSVPMQLGAKPYFVAIGTIEPRKNHLLLLNLWRQLVGEFGPDATPRLVLIGRRGWENENILDMLDRCPALKGVVEERGHLPDQEMWPLVRGARALLMPSFAEGFGLPVVEALQLGVPVLCSDIATHREIAEPVAEFLDPLDGPGWRRAILDYAEAGSTRRTDQIRRLKGWRAPTWEAHVRAAIDLADEVCR
jgi:glycosyltransferase involved in cell wall biosynthesis